MSVKFSEDVVPISDFKVNPGRVINQVRETNRPVLVTSRGRGIAVVQNLEDFERNQEELAFLRAISKGLQDIDEGKTMSLEDAKRRLGIE